MKYAIDLLAKIGKSVCKPCNTQMDSNLQLMNEDSDMFEDLERYRRLVGKLNYHTVTRPNIVYSMSVMSQLMSSPTVKHKAVSEQILCYLKRGPGCGLWYKSHGHTNIK